MTHDPDIDMTEFRPVYLSFDEAADEYEATDEFFNDAVNELLGADTIPVHVRSAVIAWFRDQPIYEQAVRNVQDEAAR